MGQYRHCTDKLGHLHDPIRYVHTSQKKERLLESSDRIGIPDDLF